jgi:nucleoid-associated protein YgaU
MKTEKVLQFSLLGLAVILSGCVVRTYPMSRDRVDQDLNSGNRGYLMGQSPAQDEGQRKTERTIRVVEFELGAPAKVKSQAKCPSVTAAEIPSQEQNRGYLTENTSSEIVESTGVSQVQAFQEYTVQKNDTLQKISKKFYGTTKRWMKIYNANKDTLMGPDKVYSGQVLKIPAEGIISEGLKEPSENLK